MKINFFRPYGEKLRQYCINNGFYTRGDNRAYSELFEMFRGINHCTEMEQVYTIVENVTEDIINHSSLDSYFGTRDETFEEIINDILNDMITIRYMK